MGTNIIPEISNENMYWIEKHRYYELKHFCLQYPTWQKAYIALFNLYIPSGSMSGMPHNKSISNPTAQQAENILYYSEKIDLIGRIAKKTDLELSTYILQAVTEGVSYDYLRSVLEIPCGRKTYYKLYRRFFWLLHRAKD